MYVYWTLQPLIYAFWKTQTPHAHLLSSTPFPLHSSSTLLLGLLLFELLCLLQRKMEFDTSRPTKLPPKFSGIFHGLAKKWKLTPSSMTCGVDDNHKAHVVECINEECGDINHSGKIHPQPFTETLASSGVDVDNLIVCKLFDSISSLKLAYIRFQQAHIPYDCAKIRSADRVVVSHLESLSDFEQFYLERQKSEPPTQASLSAKISRQEQLLESLASQVQAKDTELLRLEWEVEEVVQKNMELEEEIKRTFSPEEEILLSYQDPDPSLFPLAYEVAHKSIHEFAKPLIGLMKASEWNLDDAANYIAPSVTYAQRSHKKYAFEAYISRKMFGLTGIPKEELGSGDIGSLLSLRDPFDALINDPHSNFARFCLLKYALVVHPLMEFTFFGHVDQRNFVVNGKHPRTPFYRAFVKMARWVWVLVALAGRIAPKAAMFYAKKGSKFVERHMESVTDVDGTPKTTVGFTVTPGFWIGIHNAVRCRVYLS